MTATPRHSVRHHRPGRRGVARLVVLVAAVIGGLAMAPAGARAEGGATIGLDGTWRTGSWTPLAVRPRDDGALPTRVWVADADGESVGYEPLAPTPDGAVRFRIRCGRPDGTVTVEWPDGSRDRPRLPAPLESTARVLLILGDLPAAERAARLLQREDGSRFRLVTLADPGFVGPSPLDLDGVDVVIACGQAVATAPTGLLDAVDGWVRRGGRMLFLAGVSAAPPAFGDGPAASWLPGPAGGTGRVARMVPLRRGAAIETYAKAGRPLERGALASLEAPLLADPAALDGTIEAWEGSGPADLPLVVRRAHGFGTVTWAGLDLDRAPFRAWTGTDSLLVQLLGGRAEKGGRAGEVVRGSLDLGGQLRLALDRFEGVSAVPFEVVAGLALLYVVCLWPLEWWLVSRSGRFRLAWLTLPALVAAFTGLAWWTGARFKGDRARDRDAEILDVDMAGGRVRGTAFLALWSPDNTTLDVGAAPATPLAGPGGTTVLSWYRITGRGMGAVDSPASHPSLATAPYREAAGYDRLEGIALAAASSRLFEVEWTAPAAAPAVESTLGRDAQGTLRGTVKSLLPFELQRASLVHAGWSYDVGTLAPGATFDTLSGKGPRTLSTALTRASTVLDRLQTERWRIDERDVERILEIAGFHEAAGGTSYTSLEAGPLERLDLSPLLPIDRAILVGTGPAGTAWSVGGEGSTGRAAAPETARALVRIVIPLDKRVVPRPAPPAPPRAPAAVPPTAGSGDRPVPSLPQAVP